MSVFWNTVFPAILAGGIVGNLATMFGSDWLTNRREHKKWLRSERHKLFSELLSIATLIPKTKADKDNWTYQIRNVSQKLHILFDSGSAPKLLADAMEDVFQSAKKWKVGDVDQDWNDKQRKSVRVLRREMSASLTAK